MPLLTFHIIRRRTLLVLILTLIPTIMVDAQPPGGQEGGVKIARVKYEGGGDWYNDRSAEVNLLRYVSEKTAILVDPGFESVELSSERIFTYPILFLTGHGNVRFEGREVDYLRSYLQNGGFLYIDDDYGLDTAIRREMKRVFPDQEFKELSFAHPLYHALYDFDAGPPKIHEHDGKAPRGFGLFDKTGRLAVYYTFECNPSDGWADPEAHNDPPEKRERALQFGANIVVYALTY